jgi:transcriptional regulator with XRE-family HTH domain
MMDGRHVDREAAKRLGKNLWRARRRAGYSQENLGALANLHRTEVGMVENGERLPRIDTLMKLAAALEVRVEALVEGIEWLPPGPPPSGSFAVRGPA